MSRVMRWDPFRNPMTLRDAMDRMFEDSFVPARVGWFAPVSVANLAIDMFETKDQVTVKAALPGVKPEQVEVTVTGDTLTIRGEAKEEKDIKEENYLCQERRYGVFSRSVALPAGLQADKAEAAFENGVLTLKIPKSEQIKPKSIQVKPK